MCGSASIVGTAPNARSQATPDAYSMPVPTGCFRDTKMPMAAAPTMIDLMEGTQAASTRSRVHDDPAISRSAAMWLRIGLLLSEGRLGGREVTTRPGR
jgi:hypothetical protein